MYKTPPWILVITLYPAHKRMRVHHPIPTCNPFFFFNDTATTEIYTLSLHDALPIRRFGLAIKAGQDFDLINPEDDPRDRKSTRLNSSHSQISYAVFCLKKKKIR